MPKKVRQLPGTARGYEVRSATMDEYEAARRAQQRKQIPKGEKAQPEGVMRSDPTKYKPSGAPPGSGITDLGVPGFRRVTKKRQRRF